ncbi:trypsin-like peptidase domain-containing protein [Singulisphaera sp. GP187]|uniref:trypsin-like peptidase domain-containing protein n=1 Tax=Singulisphaera sp. GP187 TaxID=1882752 RepID=UPI0009408073|nr:trypsin-like peptidase domain-containing protein [Singulisphaera sp. GP187]
MPTTFRWRAVVSLTMLALGTFGTMTAFGQGEAESLSASFRKAAQRVLPGVVTVRPIGRPSPFEGNGRGGPFPPGMAPDGPPPERVGGGSGVVIDAENGYILTNDHVVQGSSRVVVVLEDGRERPVSQVRRDPKSDLALLIIDGKGLSPADWGDSGSLEIGDWVLAVGQPFGLSGTVTAGIVSGKGRGIGVAMYEDLIQTDAAINPGNSGGPLINLKGEIVGINTAIKTTGGGYEGVGFAIPAARARRVATDLVEHGRVRRAYLGIQIGPVDQDRSEQLDQFRAVAINGVSPDSPAAAAGLIRGDAILRLEGKPIAGPGALQAAIEFAPIDQPLSLTIDRDGERKEVQVTPKPQPESFGLPETPARPEPPGRPELPVRPGSEPPLEFGPGAYRFRGRPPVPRPATPAPPAELDEPRETGFRTNATRFANLGLRLRESALERDRRFRPDRTQHGLIIVDVEQDGPADHGGLEAGMVITRVADHDVKSLDDFRKALAEGRPGQDLVIRILKGTKAEIRLIPQQSESKSKESVSPGREPESATH